MITCTAILGGSLAPILMIAASQVAAAQRGLHISRVAFGEGDLDGRMIGVEAGQQSGQIHVVRGHHADRDPTAEQPGQFVNWVAQVLPHFGDWALDWLDVPGLVRDSTGIFEYPMADRDPLPNWGNARITLVGDAAHPMYPVGANGASQAIVDARVLAEELAGDPESGLLNYQAARRATTASIVDAARATQRTWRARSAEELARITTDYRRTTERPTWQPTSSSPAPATAAGVSTN